MKFIAIIAAILLDQTSAGCISQSVAMNMLQFSPEVKAIVGASGKEKSVKNAQGNYKQTQCKSQCCPCEGGDDCCSCPCSGDPAAKLAAEAAKKAAEAAEAAAKEASEKVTQTAEATIAREG